MCRQTLYNSITFRKFRRSYNKRVKSHMRNSLNIAPGKKLCKPCKQKVARKEDHTEEEQSQG